MPPMIGTVECLFVKGQPSQLRERTQTFIVPGMTGIGAHRVGKSDGPFSFVCVREGEEANVNAWIADISAQQGQVVEITDDWGVMHGGCLITEQSTPVKQPALVPGSNPPVDTRAEITISGMRVI